ncbi:MAG: hypothetical protein BWY06_02958 [Candidatus Latescibacteria bacterium ADurb.Bin168]|nr:MAG: hypothetical protein BWY06_02958 [Candidatus Latescibacteria bacterium ADurb.Bin168]
MVSMRCAESAPVWGGHSCLPGTEKPLWTGRSALVAGSGWRAGIPFLLSVQAVPAARHEFVTMFRARTPAGVSFALLPVNTYC